MDGFYRYKMRGDDPNHYQNRALHQAMTERLPLIWWLGVQGGGYSALYPIYLVAEERSDLQFVVEIDAVPQPDITWPRSEEHTSELQSLMRISYAVFCLKKKKNTKNRTQDYDSK